MKDQREAAQRHGLIEHVVGQQVSGIAETHHRTQGAQIEHVIGVDFLVKIFKSEDPREKEHGGKQDGKQDPQSVIDEIVKIRIQHPEIPLEEYPTTILAVSDMQFNPSGRYSSRGRFDMTNHEAAVDKLRQVFPDEYVSNIKFIWWNCASRKQTFEGNSKDENMMFFSGFDGSALGILLGNGPDEKRPSKKLTPEEVVVKVLTQEILNYIEK